jgi:hypothetical protein
MAKQVAESKPPDNKTTAFFLSVFFFTIVASLSLI